LLPVYRIRAENPRNAIQIAAKSHDTITLVFRNLARRVESRSKFEFQDSAARTNDAESFPCLSVNNIAYGRIIGGLSTSVHDLVKHRWDFLLGSTGPTFLRSRLLVGDDFGNNGSSVF
jgi:hypothetical protein